MKSPFFNIAYSEDDWKFSAEAEALKRKNMMFMGKSSQLLGCKSMIVICMVVFLSVYMCVSVRALVCVGRSQQNGLSF